MCALIGLILLSLMFPVTSLLVKITSPGLVFHHGRRVGLNGKLFGLYKVRTMVVGAANISPAITAQHDLRITPLGRILRRTKIDELPQRLNVLKGDMSSRGPRPEDPRYVVLHTSEQRGVLKVRHGVTSPASLSYRFEEAMPHGADRERTYCTEVLPAKLAIDLACPSRRTLFSDIVLISRTIFSMLRQHTP